ncbi:MAG: hypothetical protein NWE98_10195 [Candidatus Bathyarchaeota archaeon]|nr:hypothetical protein [Candidatus Bathyarchaeota archaeon]
MTAIYTFVVYKKGGQEFKLQKLLNPGVKKTSLVVFAVFVLISLAVLFSTVWSSNRYGIILSGANMQDGPFHYEIIESINNGNFPPQTPNFVGEPLSYHYFVDFHTAIVEKVYGYLPRLLPFLNAAFIGVFALAIYALARPNGRRAAMVAVVVAVFGWGLNYVGFFSALLKGQPIASASYFQYQGTFGLPPIFDNLLNQRPMLVGLPAFALVLALLKNMDDKKRLILAGVITGLVYQFHNVAFFCCYVAYAVCLLLNMRKFRFSYIYFVAPTLLALPFILLGGASFTFKLSTDWFIQFVQNPAVFFFLNLGVPFMLAIMSFFKLGSGYLKGTLMLLLIIPNIFVFTPNVWDMYKFFLFAWIPIAVLCGMILAKANRVLVAVLVLLSILTSASVIASNVSTSYVGATWTEYNVGMWVRNNTPQGSVFLTANSISAPTGFIGGRLRVSCYPNWPYGHGVPLEEIFAREHQVDLAYNGTVADLEAVVHQYKISYVYVGREELNLYPGCNERFNGVSWLTNVYSDGDLRVYRVDLIG